MVRLVGQTAAAIYAVIAQLAASCMQRKNLQISKQVLDGAAQIQLAEQTYQYERAAYDYIRGLRAGQMISIIGGELTALKFLLNLPDYQTQLDPHQLDSFLKEMEELENYLKQQQAVLDHKLPRQEMNQRINGIFQHIKEFHPHLQALHQLFLQGSPQRKKIADMGKVIVKHVHQQANIFSTPTSDTYLHHLQKNEFQAWQTLQKLKQQNRIYKQET